MLLVLDVGNTNTVLGLYAAEESAGKPHYGRLVAHWRVATLPPHFFVAQSSATILRMKSGPFSCASTTVGSAIDPEYHCWPRPW